MSYLDRKWNVINWKSMGIDMKSEWKNERYIVWNGRVYDKQVCYYVW